MIAPFVLIIGIMLGTFFSNKESISELEKRKLAILPELTLNNWMSGIFSSSVEDYLSDHVICRNSFITLDL